MSLRPKSTDDVIDLVNGHAASAALGAALELGLFRLLDREGPLAAGRISEATGVPGRRCGYWLDLLVETGLLETQPARTAGGGGEPGPRAYELSLSARRCILNAYGASTWAFLAREARERVAFGGEFAARLRQVPARPPGPPRPAHEIEPEGYVDLMMRDPDRARGFTRMLHELHLPLSAQVTEALDVGSAQRLLDLGGGSGVVAMALLRQHPGLSAVVMDIPTVCRAGRELAREHALADRLSFHPGDIVRDELPGGFDLVLECDVDVYVPELLRRVRDSLVRGGRYVIVDQFAPAEGVAPAGRLRWALERSLGDPDFAFPTVRQVRERLEAAGFTIDAVRSLPAAVGAPRRFGDETVMIEAS